MRLPNLLATRNGRLTAFFFLYLTEGIPLGFAATAVATQLRRMGVGPAEIGAFVAAFYLPWAFKWAFGPFVDVFRSQRFGHRRAWILGAQVMMALTLMALMAVPLPQGLGLFTAVLLVHNSFGALQDVAIDSLACNTLHEDERGLANGLMFGGASVGQAVGGSGVLFLMDTLGFQSSFIAVALSILLVTGLVVLPMKEALAAQLSDPGEATAGSKMASLRAAGAEMKAFAVQSFRAFIGSKGAFSGVFFALLPAGAMSLGLALQSNLAVEFGMDDDQVGWFNLATSLVGAVSMVVGGWMSDKLGRRRTLLIFTVLMSLPVLALMVVLQQRGYVMPRAPGGAPLPELIMALWVTSLLYNVFNGLAYGTRSAIFMDVTNPRVAATQFTAYMAMGNLAIALSATWQGIVTEAWGYPLTLLLDALIGLMGLWFLPAMKRTAQDLFHDALAVGRARKSSAVLGVLCLLWLPCWYFREAFGAAQPVVVGTFYTLIFVTAALFLLAAREVLGAEAGKLRGWALWLAPLLLALFGRNQLDAMAEHPWMLQAAQALLYAVPVLAGWALLALSRKPWSVLTTEA